MRKTFLLFAALAALGPLNARATLIGSADFGIVGGGGYVVDSGIFVFGAPSSLDEIAPDIPLFTVPLNNESAGQSLTANASTAEHFGYFANLLTNGINNFVAFEFLGSGGGGGTLLTESLLFGTAPDFSGFVIDRFVLSIIETTFDSPGSDPNGNGIWTDYTLNFRLDVFSESTTLLPEPASMGLLIAGLAGLGLSRKIRGR